MAIPALKPLTIDEFLDWDSEQPLDVLYANVRFEDRAEDRRE